MNWNELKQQQLKQFSEEDLQNNRELLSLIQSVTARKKPQPRVKKQPLLPTPHWVIDRYHAAHHEWHIRTHKFLHADGHTYAKQKTPDFTNTNHLSSAIRSWIDWHGGQADQYNVQGRVITTPDKKTITGEVIAGKSVMIKSSATRGATDITGTFRGRSLKIEVKNKYTKDTIKSHQEKYKQKALQSGALHLYATDMATFIHWWDEVVSKQPDLEHF